MWKGKFDYFWGKRLRKTFYRMLIGVNKGAYRLFRDDFMVNVITVCDGIIGLWLWLWFVRFGTHYINIDKLTLE